MQTFNYIYKLIQLNIHIIFGNKFIYFLLGAIGFFILSVCISIFSGSEITEASTFSLILTPALLLIFYPTCFGIQNDQDSKMTEIIFGIPDYRYKVWLFRLAIAFLISFGISFGLALITDWLIVMVSPIELTARLMVPVFFVGFFSFMTSTFTRNGNGTAVIMVIIGFLLFIIHQNIEISKWDLFINPFDIPNNQNPTLFNMIIFNNYLIFGSVSLLCLFIGMLNLQKRENYI